MKDCETCKSCKTVHANGGWSFLGCYHYPYHGKRVSEIANCPKRIKSDELCESCRFSMWWCEQGGGNCFPCPMSYIENKPDEPIACKCDLIKPGEECPYYKQK